jgi:two-component system, OmpR family, response regulator RstA
MVSAGQQCEETMGDLFHILLVEDDAKLAQLVQEFLQANGFRVDWEARGDKAVSRILAEKPELVILDLMLPGLDGLSICRAVRSQYQGRILMLTARHEEVDEVVGLELGADDYLAKPVRPRVLLARINALLRRAVPETADLSSPAKPSSEGREAQFIDLGYLVVDSVNRKALVQGREVELTTAEFDLLQLLAQHAGEILTRDQIYGALRGIEYDGFDRSIDLRITRLRKKIGDDGKQPQKIKSVRGVGYLLVIDP